MIGKLIAIIVAVAVGAVALTIDRWGNGGAGVKTGQGSRDTGGALGDVPPVADDWLLADLPEELYSQEWRQYGGVVY